MVVGIGLNEGSMRCLRYKFVVSIKLNSDVVLSWLRDVERVGIIVVVFFMGSLGDELVVSIWLFLEESLCWFGDVLVVSVISLLFTVDRGGLLRQVE